MMHYWKSSTLLVLRPHQGFKLMQDGGCALDAYAVKEAVRFTALQNHLLASYYW